MPPPQINVRRAPTLSSYLLTAVGVYFDQPTTEHASFHGHRTVSATEPFLLLDRKSGTICHRNCDTWTSALNNWETCWNRIYLGFSQPRRIVTFWLGYCALEASFLTYLLTYLLTCILLFTQEIPFGHIWNGSQSGLHCSFTLEHIQPQSLQLSCDVIVSQTLLLGNRQIIPLVCDVTAPANSPQVIRFID